MRSKGRPRNQAPCGSLQTPAMSTRKGEIITTAKSHLTHFNYVNIFFTQNLLINNNFVNTDKRSIGVKVSNFVISRIYPLHASAPPKKQKKHTIFTSQYIYYTVFDYIIIIFIQSNYNYIHIENHSLSIM